jgi:hypothetical protein
MRERGVGYNYSRVVLADQMVILCAGEQLLSIPSHDHLNRYF